MEAIDYAKKIKNGIQNAILSNGKLFIEFPSGKLYQLAHEEIVEQAQDYLESELSNLRS